MVRPTKAVSKLTVLPPLNLPSLRREHEKFDASGRAGGLGGGGVGGLGNGSRPSSTRVGWTKLVPDKNGAGVGNNRGVLESADMIGHLSGNYGSRNVSSGVGEVSSSDSRDVLPPLEKSIVLRGEEFPSLQAATSVLPATSRKEKFGLNEKQKLVKSEELSTKKKDDHTLDSLGQSSQYAGKSGLVDYDNEANRVGGGRVASHNQKKQEYFPDPLPLVPLNPRSDWADDERDTGHRFVERERDAGYLKSEGYWDRDFDFPRTSVLPQKPVRYQHERWGSQDYETDKNSSNESYSADSSRKNLRVPTQGGLEGNRWRASSHLQDGASQVGNDVSSRAAGHINMTTYNKYTGSGNGVSGSDGSVLLKQDPRGDRGLGERKEYWNNSAESYNNRGVELNYQNHVTEQHSRYKDYHNNKPFKSSSVSSRNMSPSVEPTLAAVRDRRFSRDDGSLSENPFLTDFDSGGFDERDFFSGSSLGVLKRKKDPAKPTEFHDPVRESFEAELERVQKMQELERQRVIEEQERALERARREDEERQRHIREEEEHKRILEEEAREAAWRAEKEKQEAEEQRIAREEERRRMLLEEERRKEGAKQKLLELEAKMAKRDAEAAKAGASVSSSLVNDRLQASVKDGYFSVDRDVGTWEDEERRVGKVMMTSPSDSSTHRNIIVMNSRYSLPLEGSSKVFEAENVGACSRSPLSAHEIRPTRPKWESFNSDRMVPRNELYGKSTYMSSGSHVKEGIQGPRSGESGYQKERIWNVSGGADPYERHREREPEFNERHGSEYDDISWEHEHRLASTSSYRGQFYLNTDMDDFESSGRSRYSMRQPRVLPPPIASAQRTSFQRITDHASPTTFLDNNFLHSHATSSEPIRQTTNHSIAQGDVEPAEIPGLRGEGTITDDLNPNLIARCDSQSSLVVSSPPNSPPHLSEEDLDETCDFPTSDTVREERSSLAKIESDVLDENYGMNKAATLGPISALDDEEWPIENDSKLQRLVEYDEEDNYGEEDDTCDNENFSLSKKFEELDIEVRSSGLVAERLVLGINDVSEVGIPSKDLEEKSAADEMAFIVAESSVGIVEEIGLVRSVLSSEQGPVFENDSTTSANSASGKIAEVGLVSQFSTFQPVGSSATAVLECADASGSAGLPVRQSDPLLPGCGKIASDQTYLKSGTSVGSSVDFPVNIQFGLFPGLSLLPTSSSEIQIGSIQIPIHIHHHASPASPHIHSSLPSTFQFGQLCYTAPISPEISPVFSKSTSSIHPNVQHQAAINHNDGGSMSHGTDRDTSILSVAKEKLPPVPVNMEPYNFAPKELHESHFKGPIFLSEPNSVGASSTPRILNDIDEKCKLELDSRIGEKSDSDLPETKDSRSVSQPQRVHWGIRSSFGEKGFSGQRGGIISSRGRRFAYAVKGSNLRSSFLTQDMQSESNEFQRKPFQTVWTRDKNYTRQPFQPYHSAGACVDNNSNYMGRARSKPKRNTITNKRMREKIDSEPANGNVDVDSGDASKKMAKKLSVNSEKASRHPDLGINVSEESVNAPLQSGVVCVFSQPGIEAPSDDDDFIEVRSKKHLHDRRKQIEKGLKPKLGSSMASSNQPYKQHVTRKMASASKNPNKLYVPLNSEIPSSSTSNVKASEGHSRQLPKKEVPTGLTSVVPQIPSGGSTVNTGELTIKSSGNGESDPAVSRDRSDNETGVMSDGRNKTAGHAQPSLTHWSKGGIGQQVMSLTQTQLDEAMKHARCDSNISSTGGEASILSDQILPISIIAKDKPFLSGASAVNSLLAGEKIQFGAVTSQTILLPSDSVASNEIGAPGSSWSDMQLSHKFPESKNDGSLIFRDDTLSGDSCFPLPDHDAIAETADSVAAVATVSENKVVKVRKDELGSAIVPDIKSVDGSNLDGVVGDHQIATQTQGDDSLTVSLPADLSVETAPMSLWPPLPSPQNDSTQMLSHFPGGPHTHFPYYEMNRLLGGPIFNSGTLEESSGTQPQISSAASTSSVPPVNWPHHHFGMDSFYGQPIGYPGPFMSPIGVQGPAPHMALYDHFPPVGQFGQVGLSLMGPTFFPQGKQSDWKHSPTSSAMHSGEGNIYINSSKMAHTSAPPNSMAPIHHLAPGSPLLSAPSPLPVCDVAPFQPQAGSLPSEVNRASPPHSVFPQPQIPVSTGNVSNFSMPMDTNVAPFSAELGLVDSVSPSIAVSSDQIVSAQISSSIDAESGQILRNNDAKSQNRSSTKTWFSQKNTTAHNGHNNYQRFSVSQRNNNTGNEWSHRRSGFYGRKQSFGADKGFPSPKIKQIYVAKQTNSGNSAN